MMNKEVYLKNVAESLALLSREVSILNAVNLYDINIVAEDFFPGLLNLIYGYELKNANYLEKNAPAIDLVDPKNRIAVQVTSDNSSTKIKHTIEEFNKNKAYQSYDRLIVLILTQKKKYSSNFDTQGMFSFEKERDIWDVEKLMQDVRELETEQIKAISNYLSAELCNKYYSVKETQASEVDTIIDLIEFIQCSNRIILLFFQKLYADILQIEHNNNVLCLIDPQRFIYNLQRFPINGVKCRIFRNQSICKIPKPFINLILRIYRCLTMLLYFSVLRNIRHFTPFMGKR